MSEPSCSPTKWIEGILLSQHTKQSLEDDDDIEVGDRLFAEIEPITNKHSLDVKTACKASQKNNESS